MSHMQLSFPIFTPSIKPTNQPKPKTKHLGFYLTKRDIDIIKAVYDYRGLTTHQIMALFFQPDKGQDHATKAGRCWHRLKLLSDKKFLLRHEQLQYYCRRQKAVSLPAWRSRRNNSYRSDSLMNMSPLTGSLTASLRHTPLQIMMCELPLPLAQFHRSKYRTGKMRTP